MSPEWAAEIKDAVDEKITLGGLKQDLFTWMQIFMQVKNVFIV